MIYFWKKSSKEAEIVFCVFVVCGVSVLVDDNFDVNEKMTDCRGSINESAVSEIVTQSALLAAVQKQWRYCSLAH